MGMFGGGADAVVRVPLKVIGPTDFFLPPASLLSNRKVVAKANETVRAWDGQWEKLAGHVLGGTVDAARQLFVPELPDNLGEGRGPGWDPADPLGLGLAIGSTLPDVTDHAGQHGTVRPGVVRGWLHLAVVSVFNGLSEDPLTDCLLSWTAWIGYIARVNAVGGQEAIDYFCACGLRAGELEGFVPAN